MRTREAVGVILLGMIALIVIAATQRDGGDVGRQSQHREAVYTLVADGSGDASISISRLNGFLYRFTTTPSGGDAPTANWDLTLVDDRTSFPVDVMAGKGVNRSSSTMQSVHLSTPTLIVGTYTLTGDNMGANGKAYVQILYGR